MKNAFSSNILYNQKQTTLFKDPGFTYESFDPNKTTRVAFLEPNTPLFYLEEVLVNGVDYYKVAVKNEDGTLGKSGWVKSTLVIEDFNFPLRHANIDDYLSTKAPELEEASNSPGHLKATGYDPCIHVYNTNLDTKFFTQVISGLGVSPFRTLDAVGNFTSDYRKDCFYVPRKATNTHHQRYLDSYKDYFEKAGDTFGIPSSFLACSSFVESRWDPNAFSQSSAVGLGQFLPGTMTTVNGIIRAGRMSRRTIAAQVSDSERYLRNQKQLDESESPSQDFISLVADRRAQYHTAQAQLRNRALGLLWTEYFDSIQNFPHFQNKNKKPTAFSAVGAKLPANAIGAQALYYRWIIDKVRMATPPNTIQSQEDLMEFMSAIGGSYNIGPTVLTQIIEDNPEGPPKLWRDILATKSPETKKHMMNIESCMSNKEGQSLYRVLKDGRFGEENKCPTPFRSVR